MLTSEFGQCVAGRLAKGRAVVCFKYLIVFLVFLFIGILLLDPLRLPVFVGILLFACDPANLVVIGKETCLHERWEQLRQASSELALSKLRRLIIVTVRCKRGPELTGLRGHSLVIFDSQTVKHQRRYLREVIFLEY